MFKKEKKALIRFFDKLASQRDKWINKNQIYYTDLINFYRFHIPKNSSVLEIGCGTGKLLTSLAVQKAVGIDFAPTMIKQAKKNYPQIDFYKIDAEDPNLRKLKEKFDYLIISDTIGHFYDVQQVFQNLHSVLNQNSRVIINFHNVLWTPFLLLAEKLTLKMPSTRLNWIDIPDIVNLLEINNFEIIKKGKRFLFPFEIPLLSPLFNRFLVHLPLINYFGLSQYIIARPKINSSKANKTSVSIIIPARNERGNIEKTIKRIPQLTTKSQMEIIFVEGHSTDKTWEEIKKMKIKYANQWKIKAYQQTGIGKADAVRLGFNKASKDILMILDADLTVPPEDLRKFYKAIANNQGEYIQGSRLVYPMEKEAMRFLNILGNKFFSWCFSWLLGQRIKDTLCGTKVISRKNWKRIVRNRKYFGDFDPFGDFDLLFGADKLNLKIIEIPIRYQARQYGSTNISRFKHGWLLLKMVIFASSKIKFI
ncbi:MAG: glycosyltransferase [Candidatus Woesebacteria bacterium]|jgi:SAM-dependent methyltransferase